MKDRWEHNGVVYVDAHEIIKELEKENKNLNEKLSKIQETYIRFEKLDSQFQKGLGELDQLIMNR